MLPAIPSYLQFLLPVRFVDRGSGAATPSLASSIYNYTYENGRRYHAYRSGKYALPNDEVSVFPAACSLTQPILTAMAIVRTD